MKVFKETIALVAFSIPLLCSAADQSDSARAYEQFSETIRGFNGIHFNTDLNLEFTSSVWMPSIETPGKKGKRFISKNGKMAIEINEIDSEAERDEVITRSNMKDVKKAAVTVFKNLRPESHTFVVSGEGYTINAQVCAILRQQTESKTNQELAARSKTCNDFYKKRPIADLVFENVKNLEDVHSENLKRLSESVAKDAVAKDAVAKSSSPGALTAKPTGTAAVNESLNNWVKDFLFSTQARTETPKPMPRSAKDIFTADSFKDGTSYRDALAGVAEACANFYPTTEPSVTTGAPAGSARPASGAASSATTK